MKESLHAITFAFKEILRWHTMRYALITGIIVTVIWVGIGFMLWPHIIAITSYILELVPFSMVRSNGAWMLSIFLWMQVVLLTFALIYAFAGNIILRHISKERYGSLSVIVLLVSAVFWGIVWFVKSNYIHDQFTQLFTWLPFETIEKGIAYLFGFYLIYTAIIVTMLFTVSFFSEPLIKHIEEEHFPNDEIVRDNVFKSIRYTLKDALIFTLISILVFPLLFIPFVNFLIQLTLWIWLTKNTLQYDAASLVYKKVEPQQLGEHKVGVWFISFVTALFNFIPVFNIFGPYFGEIAMFHYLKHSKQGV